MTNKNCDEKIAQLTRSLFVLPLERHDSKISALCKEISSSKTVDSILKSKLDELTFQRLEFKNRLQFLVDHHYSGRKSDFVRKLQLETNRLDSALPVYAQKSAIKESIIDNRVCVIVADTGSGKSTQIPQYLLEIIDDEEVQNGGKWPPANGERHRFLCTQPRKVAAISLAKRVAEELDVKLGQNEVGYKVSGAAVACGWRTRLVFSTDSYLLQECLRDPLLTNYDVVIVDEAHERSLNTDLTLAMLKRCLINRKDNFRIVIMSATIDPSLFSDYYGSSISKILCLPGRLHPVQIEWSKKDTDLIKNPQEIVRSVVDQVREICCSTLTEFDQSHGVLAFLTTPNEVELASRLLATQCGDAWILQMHGQLQADDQQKIFDSCPAQFRGKVVFATNSAETSVTIPDIKYVVDCGLVKERRYNEVRDSSALAVGWTSKSSAVQRAGRAGRTGPGVCYRLYSQEQYDRQMPERFIAEIKRSNMAQTLLYLYALKIEDPLNFDLIEKPSEQSVVNAYRRLVRLGALSDDATGLTEVGEQMSKLNQVEPRLSKFLVMAAKKDNLDDVAADQNQQANDNNFLMQATAIAACISVGNLFFRAGTDEQKNCSDVSKVQFCESSGDPASYLRVYVEWANLPNPERGKWCNDKYINGKCMRSVGELFKELKFALVNRAKLAAESDFDRQLLSNDVDQAIPVLNRLLLRCFNENLAMYTGHPRMGYYVPALKDYVVVHPSSAVQFAAGDEPAKWTFFEYVLTTSRQFAFNVVAIDETLLTTANGVDQKVLEDCKRNELGRRHLDEFGRSIKSFIRQNKDSLEESANRVFDGALCFIESPYKDPWQRLWLYAPALYLDEMMFDIRSQTGGILQQLINDFKELPIRHQKTATRICIGAGGFVQDVLMRNEFRTVTINKVPVTSSSEKEVLEEIGSKDGIAKFFKFKDVNPKVSTIEKWGRIAYKTKQAAEAVVNLTKGRPNFVATALFGFRPPPSYTTDGFRILITWCRRASKNCGLVKLTDNSYLQAAMDAFASVGLRAKVGKSEQLDEVYLPRLPSTVTTDEQFSQYCKDFPFGNQIAKATIIREKGFETTQEDVERFKTLLRQHVLSTTSLSAQDFQLDMRVPWKSTVEYQAAMTVSDLAKVTGLTTMLSSKLLQINSRQVNFVGRATFTIMIPGRVYDVIKDHFGELTDHVEINIRTADLKIETEKSGRKLAKITSTEYASALRVRGLVQDLLRGQTIDCSSSAALAALLKPTGVKFLKGLEKKYTIFVVIDYLRQKITFHGSSGETTKATLDLNAHVGELVRRGADSRQIYLKPPAYPSSILKSLLAAHGHNLDELVARLTDCLSVKIDCGQRRLDYCGSDQGFRQLEQLLMDLAAALPPVNTDQTTVGEIPDCSVCLCPTEAQQNYCLESCGDYYCMECALGQLRTSVADRNFPITCAKENCGKPFVVKDFENLFKFMSDDGNSQAAAARRPQDGNAQVDTSSKWESLMDASLAAFLMKNQNNYACCMTPDCPGIYQKNLEEEFRCDFCQTRMCTKCGIEYHPGETCERYATLKSGGGLDEWIKEDPTSRKLCPMCGIGVEKIDGCNHMKCRCCKSDFCWVCMKCFGSAKETYDHMSAAHRHFYA